MKARATEREAPYPMAGGRATVAQPLTLLPHELARMLSDAAELTVKRYRIEAGAERAYLSKNEAYRRYGRSVVDRWLREGLVELHKDGNGNLACRISAIQLEVAAKASNYESFFGYRPEK